MKHNVTIRLTLVYFLLASGFFIGRTAKDALFFSAAGARWLPLGFVINALLIFVVSGGVARIQGRLPLRQMMLVAWLFTLIGVLGFGAIFGFGIAATLGLIPYFAFFAFFELPYLVLLGLFWSFAEGFYTPRQSEEEFPRITGGAHLGTVFAGVLGIWATPLVGVSGLILVWALMVGLGLALIMWMWRSSPPKYLDQEADVLSDSALKRQGVTAGFQAVLRHRYAVLFMLITFCTFFVMSVFDYSLADTATSVFGNAPERLAVYLAWIIAFFGVGAFFIQLWVVPRLIKRLGIANTNLIAPSLLTLGAGGLLASYSFGAAAVARGSFLFNEYLFNQTLLPFIYGAIPRLDRTQVRSTIEGTVTNAALAIAGLFLILPATVPGFQSHWIGMAAFFGAVTMLGLSWALRGRYNAILQVRFQPNDSAGRMRHLETLASMGEEALSTELRRDLMSGSKSNILLSLNFIRERKYGEVLDSVIALANDTSTEIRCAALTTLATIIRTNEEFDRFTEEIRFPPESEEGMRRFREEDPSTLEAIVRVYLETGRANQLGLDFEYLLDDRSVDVSARSLVARHIISESGVIGSIQRGFRILEEALESNEMIENKMAAEIIGDLGYDERLCQKLCSWLDMTRERKTTESDEIETDDANDHNALRKAAMEALLKMGTKSRIGATKVFAVALKSMEDPLLCDTIVAGLTRMVSAHAELVDAVRSAWTEAGDGLQNTMLGKATKLPLMLAENAQLESEALLIDMVAKAEHQIARQALIGLERRVRSIGCLSDAGREICRSLRPEFIERICLCAAIRSSIARDSGRHDMAIDSLSYRLRELFEQYTQLVWLTYRTPENAVRFDRDMRHIHSEDILTRDLAVKSLEITFESSRNLYLEISDLVDATDVNIEKSEQDRLLGELATRRHYSWVGKGLTASVQRLFELKVDEWIAWSLTPQEPKGRQREGVVASTALENLNVALNVLSDERLLGGIPSELLARLILQGRHFTKRRGERLLYEGLKNQGIAIVFDGESSLVTGNQLTESFPSPSVWGVSATLSKQCLREGVRAGSPKVEGIRIDQRSTDAWLVSHPHATRQICRKLIGVIEELNIRESTVSKERGDLKGTLELLGSTVEYLRQIVPALQLTKERTQRRFLISSVALETKEPGSRLESKILEQYYLIVDEEKELRLRCEDDRICTMTLRDKSRGEVTISVGRTLYDEMMPYRLGRVIRKTRYKYLDEPLQTWSIDVYDDGSPFRGMVIAELDLPGYQEELPETPVFVEVLSDISDLSDFENRNLALHGPPDLLFVSRWGAK